MASIGNSFRQLREMYTQLSLGKKISFLLIFSILFAAFVGLVYWAGQPEFRILYTDLSAEDANSIVTHLKDNKIAYRISRGGTAISVPTGDYYEVRMSLANAGLPTGGGVGLELFDRKSLGMTDFQMRVAYLRAMQGELARTIRQIDLVEGCRVHLVLPKGKLFEEDRKNTTASIILKLAANRRLSDEQINGIVFLISSSVEGLEPNYVTVIDSKGRVLSKTQNESGGGSLIDLARRIERQYEQRIVGLLARSIGPEKVAAKVSVELNDQRIYKVREIFDPEGQVVRSEQIVTGKNADRGTNLPKTTYKKGKNKQIRGEKRQETINYEISHTTSTITQVGGAIKKMSVAVLIDGLYQEKEDTEGKIERTYVPRSEDEMTTYTEIIKKAVGFNRKRGDQIEVANIAFVHEGLGDEAALKMDKIGFYMQIINYALAVIGVLLFLIFVVRPLVRRLTTEPGLEAELGAGEGAPSGEAPPSERTDLHERMRKLEQQRSSLLETVARDRNAVTSMVRKWLKED